VATDIGVFATRDGGQTWFKLGKKLPRVLYWDLDIVGPSLYASGQQGVWFIKR
jgi:hypothetical protein